MKRFYIIYFGLIAAAVGISYVIVSRWQKKWHKINAPVGKKLGYPDCCIQQFCDQPPELLKLTSVNENDRLRYDAACINGEYSGFIPCIRHAKQIMAGEITLESLIKNRDADMPAFPNL